MQQGNKDKTQHDRAPRLPDFAGCSRDLSFRRQQERTTETNYFISLSSLHQCFLGGDPAPFFHLGGLTKDPTVVDVIWSFSAVEHDLVAPAAEGDLPVHVAPGCCEESRPASGGVNHHCSASLIGHMDLPVRPGQT